MFVPTYELWAQSEKGREAQRRQAELRELAYGRAPVKPRLVKVFDVSEQGYLWRCSDSSECFASAWEDSAERAYRSWQRQYAAWYMRTQA